MAAFGMLVGSAPTPASADDASSFFGINADEVFFDVGKAADVSESDWWNQQLAGVVELGVGSVRADALWSRAEPLPPVAGVHRYDFSRLDAQARALFSHHLRWFPVLDYSAVWAAESSALNSPPRDIADYAAYAAAIAGRYGPRGTFFADNPGVPYLPVTVYEIWNEPNLQQFWDSPMGPDPGRYSDLYLAARTKIHAQDQSAQVLIGGMAEDKGTFLARMVAARPILIGRIDGVSYHPYASTVDDTLNAMHAARATLDGTGVGNVPLYLTEFGFTSPTDAHPDWLREAVNSMSGSDCNIAGVFPYTYVTPRSDPSNDQDGYGFVAPDGMRNERFDAYRQAIIDNTPRHRINSICHPNVAPESSTSEAALGTLLLQVRARARPVGACARIMVRDAADRAPVPGARLHLSWRRADGRGPIQRRRGNRFGRTNACVGGRSAHLVLAVKAHVPAYRPATAMVTVAPFRRAMR